MLRCGYECSSKAYEENKAEEFGRCLGNMLVADEEKLISQHNHTHLSDDIFPFFQSC